MTNKDLPKLVRDKAIYEGNVYSTATDSELIGLFNKKIKEELYEVLEAKATGTHNQLVEECADLQEVVKCFFGALGVDTRDVSLVMGMKHQDRGSFKDGLVLEECSLWQEK